MLQRKNGATLAEIMERMGWRKHTVRGFMAGAMKKAGYTVESFKPERESARIASTSSIKHLPPSWPARQLPRRACSCFSSSSNLPQIHTAVSLYDYQSPVRGDQQFARHDGAVLLQARHPVAGEPSPICTRRATASISTGVSGGYSTTGAMAITFSQRADPPPNRGYWHNPVAPPAHVQPTQPGPTCANCGATAAIPRVQAEATPANPVLLQRKPVSDLWVARSRPAFGIGVP